MSKPIPKIAVVVLALLALAACAADEKPGPGTSGNAFPSASSSSEASASAAASSGPTAISVVAAEPATNTFTFDTGGVQSVVTGSAVLTFTNSGTVAHEARLVKIADGDFNAYRAAIVANGESPADEIANSPSVDPGDESTFGAELPTGTYALVCLLPGPDGKTFAQLGMIRSLAVTSS